MMTEKETSSLGRIRVLDVTRMAAGPFCTQILGDMGADVVKVEPYPKGDLLRGFGPFDHGEGTYFLSINRNKRSLAINFRSAEGLAVLKKLALSADVLVENFKPGVARDIGIDYQSLKKDNPRLVYASISGFGAEGPYGGWPGVDQIAQGMSGFMSLTGEKGGGPMRVGIPIGDLTAGMWAAIGVLSALLRREFTGEGSQVETTLVSALVGLLCVQGQRYLSKGEVAEPPGNDHPVIAPYGVFEASDGPFNLCAATAEMWRKLCHLARRDDLVEHPDFSDNGQRLKNLASLKIELNKAFAADTCQAWARKLIDAGIPAGPIYSVDQVAADPHYRSQGFFEQVAHKTINELKLVASPIKRRGGWKENSNKAPPVLGEHSIEVLKEAGFSSADIDDLLNKKVVHAFTGEEADVRN
jgi:crotonobetainyl-CoA:carnitine CoA-transferase CaiB-like acyl-CoA transferase